MSTDVRISVWKRNTTPGDGVVTGCGTIDGRLVYIFAQDFTVSAGSLSETMSLKICKIMDQAMKMGAPCIGINDSGGARIQEGINAFSGICRDFPTQYSCFRRYSPNFRYLRSLCRWCVYSPALTDFTLMMEGTSHVPYWSESGKDRNRRRCQPGKFGWCKRTLPPNPV